MKRSISFALGLVLISLGARAEAAAPGDVLISEIQWAGSLASTNDEWVELYNTTASAIDISGWHFLETNAGTTFVLTTTFAASTSIPAGGFVLLNARNGTATQGACTVPATCTKITLVSFTSNLANGGEALQLTDNTNAVIDTAGVASTAWFAGSNPGGMQKKSMERNSPLCGAPDGTIAASWHTNDGTAVNGQDSAGNALIGTPGAANSQWVSLPICSSGLSSSLAAADGVDTILVTAGVGGVPDSVAIFIRPVGGSYVSSPMTQGAGNTWTFAWTSPLSGVYEYYVAATKGAVTLPASPPALPDFVGFYDPAGPSCIGPARTVDGTGAVTNLNVPVLVGGVVTTPNPAFNTFAPVGSGNQFYVEDACPAPAAMNVFSGNTTARLAANSGDQVAVLGRISQFNGLTELTPKASHAYSAGNAVTPTLFTLAQLVAAPPEALEGRLVDVRGLTFTSGAWPAANADGTLTVTDDGGTTSFTLFVDKDTNIDGTVAPTSPIRLVAVISQNDLASPLLDSYDLLPRLAGDVNAAPVVNASNQSVAENALLTFTVTATDREGDTLTWSASGLPAGATFDTGTQTFTWTPDFSQAGSYPVTFNAADGFQTGSKIITITVGNTDRAPVLGALGDQTGMEGVPLAFTVSATDVDNDTLAYTMNPTPPGASLDPVSGAFTWTPAFGQAGTYVVTFRATDPGTLFDSKIINIDIAPGPRDLSVVPDLTVPLDLTAAPQDLTVAPQDLTVANDLRAPNDLSVPNDLTAPRDLTSTPQDLTSAPQDLTGAPQDLASLDGAPDGGGPLDAMSPTDLPRGDAFPPAGDLASAQDLARHDGSQISATGGCSCDVSGREPASGWASLGVLAIALGLMRRRLRRAV